MGDSVISLTQEQGRFVVGLIDAAWKARAFDAEETAKIAIELKALITPNLPKPVPMEPRG